jgi:hypothetical protein
MASTVILGPPDFNLTMLPVSISSAIEVTLKRAWVKLMLKFRHEAGDSSDHFQVELWREVGDGMKG